MGRLTVSTQLTMDGVIDRVDEWFRPDPASQERSREVLYSADAMLLGRRTFEGLSQFWPTAQDDRGFADRVNAMPKHVASRTLTGSLPWNGTVVPGELAPAVAELKRRQDLVVYGCGELAAFLVGQGLVDELLFWVTPVLVGAGTRPFAGGPPARFELVSSTAFESGIVLMSCRPAPAG